jgi:hypothetical protein
LVEDSGGPTSDWLVVESSAVSRPALAFSNSLIARQSVGDEAFIPVSSNGIKELLTVMAMSPRGEEIPKADDLRRNCGPG